MRKVLIAYFSRAGENYWGGKMKRLDKGNTQLLAEKIQAVTGGDLFRIEPAEPYPDDYRACVERSRRERTEDARPAVKAVVENWDDYDVIYVGYPNWCGTMPMPVFTFLESAPWQGKTVVPFCTHGGSGLGTSEADIRRICADARIEKGFAVLGTEVEGLNDAALRALLSEG